VQEDAVMVQKALQVNRNLDDGLAIQYAAPAPARHRASGSGPEPPGQSLGVRITGWWRWKTVIVPPNMYVIHTRRGHDRPLHIGLGISFAFNPYTDSFLIVPSATQTIILNANSICKELQGILIQAYVLWDIDDIATAYSRLDFSDLNDPMRVVNVQLREQAEAAIKDTVSTMSITEVLSDKQPIIEELTRRLKEVAEGKATVQGSERSGLGIRIVTVQIKEAVVSSTTVWEHLQKPYRASQKATARLAEIESDAAINDRELKEKKAKETAELQTLADIAEFRARREAEQYDRTHSEEVRRQKLAQEAEQQRVQAEQTTYLIKQNTMAEANGHQAQLEHELRVQAQEREADEAKRMTALNIDRLRAEEAEVQARQAYELTEKTREWAVKTRESEEQDRLRAIELAAKLQRFDQAKAGQNKQTDIEIGFEARRQQIANTISSQMVQLKAIEQLPQVAATLPKPEKLQTIVMGERNAASLGGVIGEILGVLQGYGITGPKSSDGL
jgi:flotillin